MEKLDTLKEKIELYRVAKAHLDRLLELEKQAGNLPMPEVREYISLCSMLIEKIKDEMQSLPISPEETRRKLFVDFLESGEVERS